MRRQRLSGFLLQLGTTAMLSGRSAALGWYSLNAGMSSSTHAGVRAHRVNAQPSTEPPVGLCVVTLRRLFNTFR
jgi:hypothetical protein